MKTIKLLLALAMILPSVSAAITFSITPSSQNVQPGDSFDVNLNVDNSDAFWGFSVKIDELPGSPITFGSGTSTNRLQGGFSGATSNTADRITAYAAFGGNSQGITPGTGALITLHYTVPQVTLPGTYQLSPLQLTVSDQQGNTIQGTTITGAEITVQSSTPTNPPAPSPTPTPVPTPTPTPPQQPTPTPTPDTETGFYLPTGLYAGIEETLDVPLCVSNTQPERPLKSLDVTITHDPSIVKVTGVEIRQGTGSSNIQEGNTQITITGLNIQNADCDENTGANVAVIHYYMRALGSSSLHFQSATADDQASEPFSAQTLENQDGLITSGVSQVTKSCEASPTIITQSQTVTVIYKISNPFLTPNIGGFDETDMFDDTKVSPSLPPTNLVGGSSILTHSTPSTDKVRVVMSTSGLPLLTGPGTFQVYSIDFTPISTGTNTFSILPPPPPDLEISDDNHLDISPVGVANCAVEIIEECTTDEDCDDGNACNGAETCESLCIENQNPSQCPTQCVAGTPLNCNDGDPCTFDSCADSQCHHNPIPNCGGGGVAHLGGGAGHQQLTLCDNCTKKFNNVEYKCCGLNYQIILDLCENAPIYNNYCYPLGPIPPPTGQPQLTSPSQQQASSQQPAQEAGAPPQAYTGQAARQGLAGKAIKTPQNGKIKEINLLPWIIGFIILLLAGTLAAVSLRRKHEEPSIPQPPIFIPPVETPPEPVQEITPEPEPIPEPIIAPPPEIIEPPKIKIKPKPIPKPQPPRIIHPELVPPPKPITKEEYNAVLKKIRQKLAQKKKYRR